MEYTMDQKTGAVSEIIFHEVKPVKGPAAVQRMIRRTFVLLDRNDIALTETGRGQVRKWFEEYGTSEELVTEAVQRCIKKKGHAVFAYIDAIITAWSKKGLKTLAQVREDERAYFAAKKEEGKRDD